MTRNDAAADRLEEMADRLDAMDVEYKPRAYRRAAENVREYPEPIERLAGQGPEAVGEIDGVGDAIASKVVEYVETGSIDELEELREELPVEIDALTSVEGVGPKTVGTLYEALGIRTLDDLEDAAAAGEIQEIKGFGAKTEQNILEGIEFARQAHERQLLGEAVPLGEAARSYLADQPSVEAVEVAGSLRRWKPTIGDVDVLVGSDDGERVVKAFTDWDEAETVIEAGETKASLRVGSVRVDLRVVAPGEFGAALQYFTGSRDHNVALRNRAIERDLKMNEYGVFDVSEVEDPDAGQRVGDRIGGETEESMYMALDLPLIPPELREGRGEIEAAAAGALPDLLAEADVRGDLHTHTDWSDGGNSIAEMIEGAAAFGHEYVAITDHATGPGMVGGVGIDDETLREQVGEIRAAADDADIEVFAGVEANIAGDGSISVADEILAELDLVVASPHAGLSGDGTDRLIAAAEHPQVDIIGHPTGRYLNQRPGLTIEYDRLASAAADAGTALEVNANPRRLDLGGQAVRAAVEAGATIAIDTDAHRPVSYEYMRYGVHTARRGWAEADDVLNTRDADGIRRFLA
ncbi:DNA polymerase/3'-5' exonuclease PolX [Halapricum hydrolyticum]|uniref:DNA polymerase beta n=1 Tax=Halapricum hydrolyticum TaxID=2979991 RepID=A0AAE3I9P2_9EURY|nr:DNA polymerase/3'-5' exonuclease PolX [Halapricum hydrolyticum]MCU4718412.1 DNA polymerase/3'-5' exonuclease PolX [Halapricum hydrolyticum]MCU4726475.1 DNA polymerase/3'-5' exonuclease PolX [Halapricum hydrolyticum]